MSPNTNSNTFSLNTIEGISISGSGSYYLSNDIFYRVVLMRERWQARNPNKPKFPTGHFHLAWVQRSIYLVSGEEIERSLPNLSDNYYKSARNIYEELYKLIKTVQKSIEKTIPQFTDLF